MFNLVSPWTLSWGGRQPLLMPGIVSPWVQDFALSFSNFRRFLSAHFSIPLDGSTSLWSVISHWSATPPSYVSPSLVVFKEKMDVALDATPSWQSSVRPWVGLNDLGGLFQLNGSVILWSSVNLLRQPSALYRLFMKVSDSFGPNVNAWCTWLVTDFQLDFEQLITTLIS